MTCDRVTLRSYKARRRRVLFVEETTRNPVVNSSDDTTMRAYIGWPEVHANILF